ncbi:hypothetical protein NEOLEDRAFT_1065920 [Neolentinus lepideus HHB14362 ss-1]|uniref:Uncharacterized protein n=1 Tax=Neolentinus lepideus HHB14362 ss-1 TaxID=1314782 RepID=A0A165SK20_9AGAM|nr:hypothetical protein NEOLEDRAFT_1080588 [Neolentinus lepideus HHB14362 ss-1]KZT25281.1 hypothetical protein NEOLEDRAFT_1065920 [Neolentinus lepideus HHB14362 ss-1]
MPDRIEHDPSLQICPDYSGEEFAVIRAAAASHRGVSEQSIAEELSRAWSVRNDAAKAAWAAQQAEDRAQQGNNDGAAIPDTANTTADRKKATLAPFDPSRVAPDFLRPRPSAFATHKLEAFEYIELWYFTTEGCLDALSSARSTADNTFGLATEEDVLALRPIAAHKPSKAAIADDKLSWRQMEMGFTGMLAEMESAGWDTQHHGALANLFWNLTNHEYRSRPHGETALITYQARIRRHWHDTLKRGEGYNIATINDRLLAAIMDEVWDKYRMEAMSTYVPLHSLAARSI